MFDLVLCWIILNYPKYQCKSMIPNGPMKCHITWFVAANKGSKKELFLEQNLILITLESCAGGKSGAQCDTHVIDHQIKSHDLRVSRDIIHLCHKCYSVMIPTFDLFHHLTTVKRIRSCSTRPKLDFTSPVATKRISSNDSLTVFYGILTPGVGTGNSAISPGFSRF